MSDINIQINVLTKAAQAAVQQLEKQTAATTKGFTELNKAVSTTALAFASFAGNIAADIFRGVVGGAKDLVKSGIDLQIEIEKLEKKFEALTGSASASKQILEELNQFSDNSPFEFKEVASAAQRLLTFGVEANNVKDVLRTLGDISAASGANLEELAIAFGKVSSAGFVTGRELSLFQNNAIPVLDALSQTLGVTTASVKKLAADGKISSETFQKALESLGKEGGFAFQAMQKQSETLSGRLKGLEDAFENIQRIVGGALSPAFKAILTSVTALINSFAGLASTQDFARQASRLLVDGFIIAIETVSLFYRTVQTTRGFLFQFLSTISDVAAGAVDFSVKIIDAYIATRQFLGLDTSKAKALKSDLEGIRDTAVKFSQDLGKSADEVAMNITQVSQLTSKLSADVEKNFNKEIKAAEAVAVASTATTQSRITDLQNLTSKSKEEQDKQLQDKAAFDAALAEQQAAADAARFQQILLADGEITAQEEMALEAFKFSLAQRNIEQQIADQTALGNKQKAAELRKKQIEDQAKFEVDTAKKVTDLTKRDQQQRLSDQSAFLSTVASLQNSSNKGLITIGRAAATAQVLVEGAKARASSFAYGSALGGPILGRVFEGLAIAAQASQIAQINGIKFADGGIVPGTSFSGDRVAAQVNSGEMILNREQQANLFKIANGSGAGESMIQTNITVELDGEVVGRAVSRQVANGLKLGEVA